MWAWEIGAAIDRDQAEEGFGDEEWFSCDEWVEEDEGWDEENNVTPQWTTESISRITPRAERQTQHIKLTDWSNGTPQIPLKVAEGTRETGATAEGGFAFSTCWLCGRVGCECMVRSRQKKQRTGQPQSYFNKPHASCNKHGFSCAWLVRFPWPLACGLLISR